MNNPLTQHSRIRSRLFEFVSGWGFLGELSKKKAMSGMNEKGSERKREPKSYCYLQFRDQE
jgi:hypothetical protein